MVEEACSGVNSVMVVLAITLFYLLWCRRSLWCFLICIPAMLGCVVMGNVFRITLGAWLRFHNGPDLLTGWKHETLGLILVAIYIGLLISLEHLLYWPQVGGKKPGSADEQFVSAWNFTPARRLIPSGWGWVAGILFGIMGITGVARGHILQRDKLLYTGQTALREGAVFDLPEQIGTWKRTGQGNPNVKLFETTGLSSMLWEFKSPSHRTVGIAFDYPIWGYHDVTVCYVGNGWKITRRERITKDENTPPWLEMAMRKDAEGGGSLWVSTINERGQWMEVAQVKRSFVDRLRTLGDLGGAQETSYRIQALVIDEIPLSAEEHESVSLLFQECRALLARQLLGQIDPNKEGTP